MEEVGIPCPKYPCFWGIFCVMRRAFVSQIILSESNNKKFGKRENGS